MSHSSEGSIDTAIRPNEVRITQQGRVCNYLSRATTLLAVSHPVGLGGDSTSRLLTPFLRKRSARA